MNKDVWLFPQNSCNMQQFFITLKVFGELNGIKRDRDVQQTLMKRQSIHGMYNPYIKKDHYDISSANHKIDEPRFYGAIYETSNKKIHVSSYGELLLKYENNIIKRNKIFIAMLCNIQFDNPYKKMKNFDIYPMRLIFELLRDTRLDRKLTNLETSLILYNIKHVRNKQEYNEIVDKIIKFRSVTKDNQINILKNNAQQFIKNFVSCNYLFNILSELKITNQEKEEETFFIKSPVRVKPTNISTRILTLNQEYTEFVDKYKEEFSVFEETKKITGLRSDWIREIYNSVPQTLLIEIGESDDIYTQYLQIPKVLLDASIHPEKWSVFEEYITKSFNLFEDIEAETISGPGEPDSLCHYIKENIIFCADAKSTGKKLSSINDGRLRQHRDKYRAKYTIIVTPGYVPSAIEDIRNTNTCIITSYCFADLITKYIFKLYKSHQECSYEIFNNLILENLGTDISEKIYKIIDDRLGINIDNI